VGVHLFHDRGARSAVLIARMQVAPYEAEPEGAESSRGSRGFRAHARRAPSGATGAGDGRDAVLFGVSHSAILPVFREQMLGSSHYFTWIVVATGVWARCSGALAIGYRSQGTSMQGAALLMIRLQRRDGGVRVHARARLRAPAPVRDRLDLFRADDRAPDDDPVDRRTSRSAAA
jgi:hypothetical protein